MYDKVFSSETRFVFDLYISFGVDSNTKPLYHTCSQSSYKGSNQSANCRPDRPTNLKTNISSHCSSSNNDHSSRNVYLFFKMFRIVNMANDLLFYPHNHILSYKIFQNNYT